MLWVQAEFPVCIQSFPLCFPKLVQIAGRETSLGIATSSRDGCEAGGTLGVSLHPGPPCPLHCATGVGAKGKTPHPQSV